MSDTDRQIVRRSRHLAVIFCPACKHGHALAVDEPNGLGAKWTWNGSIDKPTFSPSLLVQAKDPETGRAVFICHSFIRDGMIEYLNDCTHEMAGKTVPLEPF